MKNFNGKVLFLDRCDINTDEIIPAKYLTEITKEALKPYLLEDLRIKTFDPEKDIAGKSIVMTRENFGCGSSREHAPWALEVNNINAVFAISFARIFRQNMYNCGMLAMELPKETNIEIFDKFSKLDTEAEIDISSSTLKLRSGDITENYKFDLTGFDRSLIESGGWVDFADRKY